MKFVGGGGNGIYKMITSAGVRNENIDSDGE